MISKKLKNYLKIEGDPEILRGILSELDNLNLKEVEIPKNMKKLTSKWIDSNWDIKDHELKNTLLYSFITRRKLVIAFR